MKILIIEDERELSASICAYLKNEKFFCEAVYDFKSAIEKISLYEYACIILDISLPGGSGMDILKELKANNKAEGVLIISAKNSLDDKVSGLKTGADDYLTKPFYLPELGARVAAIIRRKSFDGNNFLQFDELLLNLDEKTVKANNTIIDLTRKEYDLLIYFISNKNKAGKTLKDIVIAPKQSAKGKWWLAAIVLMVMIVAGLFVFLITRQRAVIKTKKEVVNRLLHTHLSIEELFIAPDAAIPLDDKSFYKALSHAIWSYISLRMSVSGSEMNKTAITSIFTGKGIEPALADELIKILHQCEAGVYTTASIQTDKTELLNRAKKLLEEMENSFSA